MPVWVVQWRTLWKQTSRHPQPLPLPLPSGRSYVSQTLLELLSAGPYDYPMHRCNFAVMFLSELVVDMYNFEWAQFLPRILHVLTLGESCCICMQTLGQESWLLYRYEQLNRLLQTCAVQHINVACPLVVLLSCHAFFQNRSWPMTFSSQQ